MKRNALAQLKNRHRSQCDCRKAPGRRRCLVRDFFDSLMSTLEKKRASLAGIELNRQDLHLGKVQSRVDRRLVIGKRNNSAAGYGKRIGRFGPPTRLRS